jgi:hypothetical protein
MSVNLAAANQRFPFSNERLDESRERISDIFAVSQQKKSNASSVLMCNSNNIKELNNTAKYIATIIK